MLSVQPQRLGVDLVGPSLFAELHGGVGAQHVLDLEQVSNLLQGQDLAVVFGGPAQQADVVDETRGKETHVPVAGHADDRAMPALGQFRSVRADEQRHVPEFRHVVSERFKQHDVLEGVGEVVLAANHMGDLQVAVVHGRGEVIGGQSVTAQEGEVFDVRVLAELLAQH